MGTGASSTSKARCSDDHTRETHNENRSKSTEPSKTQSQPESFSDQSHKVKSTPIKKLKQPEVTRLKNEIEEIKKSSNEKDACIKEMQEKLVHADQQMGQLECKNFDLQDRVQYLEQMVSCVKPNSGPSPLPSLKESDESVCPETLQAKDKYIEQLEKETAQVRSEIKKLKIRCKRKIRALNAQLAEAEQAQTVKMLERGLETNVERSSCGDSNNSRVIIQLSTKVEEQEANIADLNKRLADKEKLVSELKESKPRSESSELRNWTSSCITDIINNAETNLRSAYHEEPKRITSAGSTKTSDWSSDGDEDDRTTSTPSSYQLDPASIRRISAPKDRRRQASSYMDTEELIKSLEVSKRNMPEVY